MEHREESLDGLRGIAISMVMAYHYVIPCLPLSAVTATLAALASSGVDLFFVLSGYLLGGILLDQRASPHYFSAFYARRMWRTLPLYGLVVMIGLLVHMTGYDARSPVLREPLAWWSYATMTQNITRATVPGYGSIFTAPTWSLALEEQFYLILPGALWMTPRRHVSFVGALAVAAAPVFRLVAAGSQVADPYTAAYAWPLGRLDALAMGLTAAWLVRHVHERRVAGWPAVVVAAALSLAALVVAARPRLSVFVVIFYSALACAYGAVVLRVVASPATQLSQFCRRRWLCWVGVRAYGIYLLHIPVAHLLHWGVLGQPILNGHGLKSVGTSALALAVTLMMAHVSWQYFERPLVRWSRSRWHYDTVVDTRVYQQAG
jgi:peptidoglycan/LPS O-acetylase OafA/YrhL